MHFHKCEIVIYILCQAVIVQSSDSSGSDYDEITTTEQTEEEWHMDFMPTGYLPDSVYRELAWYGILQIQPLHHSSKHKVAAQLIWQHTLGRPHVIMENPPQSTQSPGKVSRQILAEEAAKWSREQRAAQEVLMENIKSGGNGLTVRTVVSAHTKTIYIIQNGNYYKCPEESEPDLDAYRVQANMHERKCTFGKSSISVPVDPCIEAEMAPIEYSFHEGWMFCLGNGERENNYFQNGTLDCGNKTKVAVDEFLDLCAIDNNIVITFDYFGDEPRKDMMHNATLCTSWDPCRLSYLYRLEPPPAEMTPSFPTSTPNPCETTVCDECIEGYTEEGGVVINESAESQPSPVEFEEKGNESKVKLWISGTNEEAGIHNEYWLYTRKNRNSHELLEKQDTKSARSPHNLTINYKPSVYTYVIAHGWMNDGSSEVNTLIKEALLDVQDCNVIVLDWSYITENFNYIASSNGVVGVGKALGVFLEWLVKENLADWNKMHLIGFSLGAHVVGIAGRYCGGRPRRVTGLDPALPRWKESKHAIDRTSGQYVEIIHTNGGVFGIINPVGHADFYPNGGSSMPGCIGNTCCHSRSWQLFASSIREPYRFTARHCNNLQEARKTKCNGLIQYMGNADMEKKNGVGIYALTTGKKWPF